MFFRSEIKEQGLSIDNPCFVFLRICLNDIGIECLRLVLHFLSVRHDDAGACYEQYEDCRNDAESKEQKTFFFHI